MALDGDVVEDFAQRMWAFLTIKDLLRRRELSISTIEKEQMKARALELSLRYEFVTSLTSLIVLKPSEFRNDATTPSPVVTTIPQTLRK